MSLKKRVFTKEFKLQVVHEVDACKPQAQVAREHQVNPNTIAKWRKLYKKHKDKAFAGHGKTYTEEARVAELERMVGRLTMQCELLKKALLRLGN